VTTLLAFTVIGVVYGCIYAVAASGLVVTYTTSGIFNFAHGAIGMVMAFTYWELRIHHGWPAPLALLTVLGILAPLTGALIERVLIRPLQGASIGVSLMATLGLLLILLFSGYAIWNPSIPRRLPGFFGQSDVSIFGVNVTYHELTVVLVAAAVAVLLRLFLYRTRIGIAMRAVVDDPELTALNAAEPNRVSQTSWALGAFLAALAGILIAPITTLQALTLTLLVVNAYAAAMVGRLKSLPLTFAGALALGLFISYGVGYLPHTDFLNRLREGLPTIFLFVLLLALPSVRLRAGRVVGSRTPRIPSFRTSVIAAAAFVAAAAVVARMFSIADLITAGDILAFSLIMLSLVLLTGYGGQVSLCQLTFVGIGAFVTGKVGAGPLGLAVAIVVCALIGAVVALPSLRLQGLYLALSTLAFARFVDVIFFNDPKVFGFGGGLAVDRFHALGISFRGERIDFVLLAFVFAAASVGILTLRRGPFGRRLAALGDSPAACATLGMNLTITKLAVFSLSAGLAGLAGALFGGLHLRVGASDFTMLESLVVLLLVTIGGINNVSGAFLGGLLFSGQALLARHVPEQLSQLTFLGTGLGAISLAWFPSGISGTIGRAADRWRSTASRGAGPPPVRQVAGTAQVELAAREAARA
jgi:branched-chain amino acid transport system permease protein